MKTENNFSRCLECGMIERDEWILEDKHICNKITDYKYIIIESMLLKIGKKRFVKIIMTK